MDCFLIKNIDQITRGGERTGLSGSISLFESFKSESTIVYSISTLPKFFMVILDSLTSSYGCEKQFDYI